jgi:hypothetical protein
VVEQALDIPSLTTPDPAAHRPGRRSLEPPPRPVEPAGRGPVPASRAAAIAAALAVLLAAVAVVAMTGMRPGYDAFGWLVWGHQVLHWNLNTDGAPSWKPLTFLLTLPYALAGRGQMWLWMVTAVGGALAGGVFAGRIAHLLTDGAPAPARRFAAVFAGLGVLGLAGYSQQVLIANSDPLIVTLCLAAIDAHLRSRRRLAFALVVLAALGRPEAWVLAGLYAAWLWRGERLAGRAVILAAVAAIPAWWFVVPGLTSHSWFISGDLALNQATAIHGDKLIGVVDRLRGLWPAPMQVAIALALALAIVRRDRRSLALAGCSALWTATEVVFALHGWSAVPRYLLEPAAVLVVVAGVGAGRALACATRRPSLSGWAPALAALALTVALVPSAVARVGAARTQAERATVSGRRIERLGAVIAAAGGPARILACGQPVTFVGFQSTVAWEVGLNVGNVGYRPGAAIDSGAAVVLIRPHAPGWQLRPYDHGRPATGACAALRRDG